MIAETIMGGLVAPLTLAYLVSSGWGIIEALTRRILK
jgi:hypothetical protein